MDFALSPNERDELGHLDYLLARLPELRDRGLLTADSCETLRADSESRIEQIGRDAQYRAAINRAQAFRFSQSREALDWAEKAREIDPARADAWDLLVSIHWRREEDQAAIALCEQAVERFPQFEETIERLRAEEGPRALARRQKAEQAERQRAREEKLTLAKAALDEHRDHDALALCEEILRDQPGHIQALASAAFALRRMDQTDRALELYERLVEAEPTNSAWTAWARKLRLEQDKPQPDEKSTSELDSSEAPGDLPSVASTKSVASRVWSWQSFSGEFLKEHWQKLILCVAVLFIVVSSTVGANLILGDLLWTPMGICAIALVMTALFASLGTGLVRWGATRSGRVMLIATLIVVPIHFMLAGELKLISEPPSWRYAFLALDIALLIAMVRWTSGNLAQPHAARFMTAALLLVSVGSAATTRGSPIAWGLQFTAFQLSAVVFLVAVWLLCVRQWGETPEEHLQFVYVMLGVLGCALLSCLFRAGAYAMRLEPALYAVPVMFAATALVMASHRLAAFEPSRRRLASLRLGGFSLSALAIALALSRSHIPSVLSGANLLAAGLIAVALYVSSLRRERQPAFLYLTLGASLVAGIGLVHCIRLRFHLIEQTLCWLLGYPDHLPRPFFAILAIPINVVLAWLSFWFVRHWNDRTLARHCHYLGLPLSVAACLSTGFEPLAGCIGLAAYAILYIVGTRVLAVPGLAYLGVASACGATYCGSTLHGGITLAEHAFLAGLIGLASWGARVVLGRMRSSEDYIEPWRHCAIALAMLAMTLATLGLASARVGSLAACGAFLLVLLIALLVNRDAPRLLWAWMSVLSFVELTIAATSLAAGGVELPARHFGLLFAADALAAMGLFELLRRTGRRKGEQVDGAAEYRVFGTFCEVIPRFAIVLIGLADACCLGDIQRGGLCGIVFLMNAVGLFWLTRAVPARALVYVGLAHVALGVLDLAYWTIDRSHPDFVLFWLTLVAANLSLALWVVATVARRLGLSTFYTDPCFHTSALLSAVVAIGAVDARYLGLSGYRLGVAALGASALVSVLLSRTWRKAELIYAAVFGVVEATYLVLFSTGTNDPRMAYVLGLVAVIEALVLWTAGIFCKKARDPLTASSARPLDHWAVLMTALAVVLSAHSSLTLALVAISCLVAVKGLPRAEWLYGVVAALVAACYERWLWQWGRVDLMACALLAAFGFWGLGVLIQHFKPAIGRRLGLVDLPYEFPLFHSSIAAAILALAFRLALVGGRSTGWSAHAWLPLGLAVLCLVLVRAYPRRDCLHASLVFLTWAVVAFLTPWLAVPGAWVLAVALLSLVLLELQRLIRPFEPALCVRLGIADDGYSGVLGIWSFGLFFTAAAVSVVVLIDHMGMAIFGNGVAVLAVSRLDWWAFVIAFGLLGATLVSAGRDPDGWVFLETERVLIGLYWIFVCLLWWLGDSTAPLPGLGLPAGVFYPLVTAFAGLATAHVLGRFKAADAWDEGSWLDDVRSEPLARLFSIQAIAVTALGVVFTRGVSEPSTVLTLVLAALTLGVVAVRMGWNSAALSGGAAWAAAWGVAGQVVAGWQDPGVEPTQWTLAGAGVLIAAFSLWALAGWLRREESTGKLAFAGRGLRAESVRSLMAVALEKAALGSALIAAGLALFAATRPNAAADWISLLGVEVILVAALLPVLLAARWQVEWLVYLAQALILAAYLDYRLTHAQPASVDAAFLMLLSFFEIALAEILDQLHATLYSRPARYFSLGLPVLMLIELTWRGQLDRITLFYVTAAAAYYSVACAQLRWKPLGYAAAVLYNAALWILWETMGWELSDHVQFFFVPVGFSTILFAEVNRRELGRDTVNTIRTAGLLIIYGSLAFPIWQEASFGAWLGLLIASLAGIFLGIGLRLQTFLWLGLVTCVLDVLYELGRVSLDHALLRWFIMLSAGIGLVLFVALNEKKQIVATMQAYWDIARQWE
jgi:tetratricopeptide (TPR) repeat protein